LCFATVGFGPEQFRLRRAIPEIRTAGAQEPTSQLAERTYQRAGFGGLVGSARELKKKLLKGLFRMRLSPEAGISDISCQATPSA
jgi:hypothetical protein